MGITEHKLRKKTKFIKSSAYKQENTSSKERLTDIKKNTSPFHSVYLHVRVYRVYIENKQVQNSQINDDLFLTQKCRPFPEFCFTYSILI